MIIKLEDILITSESSISKRCFIGVELVLSGSTLVDVYVQLRDELVVSCVVCCVMLCGAAV